MYIAYAHSGFAWLNNIGEFHTKEEALDALQDEYHRQTNDDTVEAYGSENNWSEIYWADCKIDAIY